MADTFIGRGWAFPLGVSPSGGMNMIDGNEEISQSIRLILGTDPGERPMRPEFGCAIRDFVFDSVNASFMGAVACEVRRALERWEPRIVVDDVHVTARPEAPEVLYIDVAYHLSHTNSSRNLVYPFYVIPVRREADDQSAVHPQRDTHAPA
ncbi:GPW/gp25 family protein [Streptomyces sp. AV19]|uniref:GPW/gp25 family protein n=1 Tax=Streptomyces sp. AV19 TaxID=2793068 RepID=UPI0018FE4574|nr:GPW/gp25 family protein [Streptomyces sp. AV19]MBH1939187.1 GPW/gp25 family protein [Streptomyces sp. AV19]MDG4536917.1 GPW/gp25 family protein [Streptomyces sp. AV19]